MVLAIESDGASYHQSRSVRDRDRLRGEHLQRLGWSFHRLWSTNWFHDPQAEVSRLRDAYQRAVDAADPPDAQAPPAQSPAGPSAPPEPGHDLSRQEPAARPAPPDPGHDLSRQAPPEVSRQRTGPGGV